MLARGAVHAAAGSGTRGRRADTRAGPREALAVQELLEPEPLQRPLELLIAPQALQLGLDASQGVLGLQVLQRAGQAAVPGASRCAEE